jgi:hypothetical protein
LNCRHVLVPKLNRKAHFCDREAMKRGRTPRRYRLYNAHTQRALPPAKLPIDWTKGDTIPFPMDDNDVLGDCFYAAAEHGDNTWTANVGVESAFDDAATKASYLALSGGDNGLDEGQITGEWKNRGLNGIKAATILDWLDIDPLNAPLVQSAMQLFGHVQFQLAVPDLWINNFTTGYVWDAGSGVAANPNNGHAIIWNGVDANGRYKLQTWGTHGWITPAGVAVCDPTAFVAFSLRWFNALGYAPNGKHYTELAALWVQAGGKPLPVSPYPAPTPGPTPQPPGPTPQPPPPAPPPAPPADVVEFVLKRPSWPGLLVLSGCPSLSVGRWGIHPVNTSTEGGMVQADDPYGRGEVCW